MGSPLRRSGSLEIALMFVVGAIATVIVGLVYLGIGVEEARSLIESADPIVWVGTLGILLTTWTVLFLAWLFVFR